jgi:hypothetical protein
MNWKRIMSFYVYGTHDQTPQSLATIVTLAEEGEIDTALRKWKQHQDAGNRCVCGNGNFDLVCCGFCLTGKLLYLELLHANSSRGVDYLQTARAVSAYVGTRSATAASGAAFYQPAMLDAGVLAAPEGAGKQNQNGEQF